MDSRSALDSAAAPYLLDSEAGQGLLRSSSAVVSHPHSHILSAAAGSLPPHQALGGYLDRDILAMQQISGGAPGRGLYDVSQYTPAPLHSLSSGQGYYTVESLEGSALNPGDLLGSLPQLLLQDRERSMGLGQQGGDRNMLSAAFQKIPGEIGLASSGPPFGIAASAPYLASHLSQELDVGKVGLGSIDLGVPSYLNRAAASYLPEGVANEQLVPLNPLRLQQELELRSQEGMMLADLERRRLLEHTLGQETRIREAQIREAELGHEAQLREAQLREVQRQEAQLREAQLREAQIREAQLREVQLREAQIREAQLREAHLLEAQLREAQFREDQLREAQLREALFIENRMREARTDFLRERSLERRDRFPYIQRPQGLSSSYKRSDQGAIRTFCSVCKLECNSISNLKSHLAGKRHKLKLEGENEEATKKTEKPVDKEESVDVEDDAKDGKLEPQVANVNGDEKTINKFDGKEVEPSNLGKRSASDDGKVNITLSNKKLKYDKERSSIGAYSHALDRSGTGAASRKAFRCETCNVSCTGKVDLQAHLRGRKHAMQVELQTLPKEEEADKAHISAENLEEDASK